MPLDTVSDELSVTACETFGLSASPHAGPGPRLSSFGVGRGHDLRDHRFLDRKATLARLLRDTEAGILFNEHVAGDGPTVFEHACRLGAEGNFKEGRRHLSIRSVPGLGQGSQSGQHCRPAGAQRELEQVSHGPGQ